VTPLRNRQFRLLFVGQSLSFFGDTVLFLSLGILAKQLTGSNALAGTVFLMLALPSLAAPLTGYLVDRVRRRPLMIVVDLATCLAVLPLLLVRDGGHVWVVLVVALLYGLSLNLISGARTGLVKDMLPGELLGSANALLATFGQGLRLIAPLVGAGLLAAFGITAVVLLDVATFVIAVVALSLLRVEESAPEPRGRLREDLVAGFRHVRRTSPLFQLMVTSGIAFSVLGFFDTIIFAVVDDGLHRPATLVGVLLSVQGAGSVLGGIASATVLRRVGPPPLVGLGMVAVAAGALLLLPRSLPVVAAGFLLDGLALPWLIVGFMTALQRWTPPRLQGGVMAVTYVSLDLPQALSIGAGALLISFVDYRALLALTATVVMVCGGVLLSRPAAPPRDEELVPLPGVAAAGAGPQVVRSLSADGQATVAAQVQAGVSVDEASPGQPPPAGVSVAEASPGQPPPADVSVEERHRAGTSSDQEPPAGVEVGSKGAEEEGTEEAPR
jgi:MFS family permease